MEKDLYKYLNDLEIEYTVHEHQAFFTCKESGDFYTNKNMGADCKNIFMRNRKGKKHYLICVLSHKTLDIPTLATHIDEHPKMSFASPERLKTYLGLLPGSVTPFSLLNPSAKEVEVIIDPEIFNSKDCHFHPLRNTATVQLSTKDFKKYLDSLPQKIRTDIVL